MAVYQTKKGSDLQKKVQQLNQQLSGKQVEYRPIPTNIALNTTLSSYQHQATESISDVTYLKQSLRKIVMLSTLAISTQILLYFLMTHNYIKFGF